jgi:predicted TPR repeat methyltransferase
MNRRAATAGRCWLQLATGFREQRRAGEAVEAYYRAIACDPALSAGYEQLGRLLYRERRATEAAALYRHWHRMQPRHAVAAHMLAATSEGGGRAPSRASNAFVTEVFDHAAETFDEALATLGYCAPQLLADKAAQELGAPRSELNILDLGCGTGLCGPLFRPWARRLVGVDLSAAMLGRAQKRAVYDELLCADILDFLSGTQEQFDLIVAADVFCYFGELRAALGAAARTLVQPGGRILFSVEELESDDDFRLLEHGRYAQTMSYVMRVIQEIGLVPDIQRSYMLRFERGAPVPGLLAMGSRT